MTLITGIKGCNGLIMGADTEVTIPEVLRTRGEKIYVIAPPAVDWRLVISGAGHADHIGMARDFISERVSAGHGNDREIVVAIRESINELWRDYARYEPGGAVDLRLLIGSWSCDQRLRLTVVSGTAVRDGGNLEAFGIGDATFRVLSDRFLPHHHAPLSSVAGSMEAVRIFTVYAMLQAKLSVPGVGGNSRIVTIAHGGDVSWEKSAKVTRLQQFFSGFDGNVGLLIQLGEQESAEQLWEKFYKITSREIRQLRKDLGEIAKDDSLF